MALSLSDIHSLFENTTTEKCLSYLQEYICLIVDIVDKFCFATLHTIG